MRRKLCYLLAVLSLEILHLTFALGVYSTLNKPTFTHSFSNHQRARCASAANAIKEKEDVKTVAFSSVSGGAAAMDRARDFLQTFETAWNSQSSAENIVQEFFISDQDKQQQDDDDNMKMNDDLSKPKEQTPFWRDMVAYTWKIGTHEGSESITQAIQAVSTVTTSGGDGASTSRPLTQWKLASKPIIVQVTEKGGLEFWCDLTINTRGTGKAHFRIAPSPNNNNNNKYQIQTLLTTLLELSDRPFQVGANRIRGQVHGPIPNRRYWPEQLQQSRQQEQDDDFVVIIGGGQAGLALGARLQFMNIPYTILEAGSQPGIAWRKRYPSLHLHDPVWYNHMPYLPFPETWPILCPGQKIADWMEFYAKVLDLNVETNSRVTRVIKCSDDNNNGMWEVYVNEASSSSLSSSSSSSFKKEVGPKKTFRAKHVVFATGNSSKPRVPSIPGHFSGIQFHSSQYQGGRAFANKRVVVIGSNNSGFDIAQDLWEQGAASVTMIQRSPSMVVSTESVLQHGLGPLYRQDAPLHHEEADLVATSTPYKLLIPRWKAINQQMQQTDKILHQNLVDAGYQLDFGPDETGIFAKSATEGGGFYIDMGCAELLIRGDVMIRYATVSRFENDQVVILDKKSQREDSLPADVIIYATGFDTMDQWVDQLCGHDIAKRVGRTWGLGFGKRPAKDPGPWQGELRNMWKPTTVEGLWFHGGNLAQARHYSRFLALQLAARYIGLETRVYGIPEPTEPIAYNKSAFDRFNKELNTCNVTKEE